jgi:hypothetical protein
MKRERTRIANPIYDGAFKYLLADERVARLFLSTIIGEQITKLDFRPTEYRADLKEKHLTVFRMDFTAGITLPDGSKKLIILEIQKAKFATDIMRFRRYLGSQYSSTDNVREANGRNHALPIVSIYFLGHPLENIESPVVKVVRQYQDASGNVLNGAKEDFIESLTHDSYVVQIPRLKQRRQNDLESLLCLFDQSQKEPGDAHHMSIVEDDYPKRFHPVIRRLIKAASDIEVRNIMDVEDEVLGELEALERQVANREELIEQSRTELALKDAVIEQKDIALAQRDAALERAIAALVASGLSEAQARAVVLK